MAEMFKTKKILSTGVFEKTGVDTISIRNYYLIMCGVLIEGLGLTALLSQIFADVKLNMGLVLFLGLCIPIVGIFMVQLSKDPKWSLLGFHLIVIPFGVLLGPVIAKYVEINPNIVTNALIITTGVSINMMLAGLAYPKFFSNIGGALFIGLIGLLVIRILQGLMGIHGVGFIDYFAAGLFSMYIGYDMYRSYYEVDKTVNNAIDMAAELFLDILNLFLNILRIYLTSDD